MQTLRVFTLVFFAVTATNAIRLVSLPDGFKISDNGRDARVVGGKDAHEGMAKYQISLQGANGGHMCGGVILDSRHILTASHCVYGFNRSYLRVITGTNRWKKPGKIYHVEDYWTHCMYKEPMYANDIAIIRTTKTIVMDYKTQPIELAEDPPQNGTECLLTGWGLTELPGETPEKLQKIKLKYLERESCRKALGNNPNLDLSHICTTSPKGKGACRGDSGGPLVCKGKLTGLVSWGLPCALGKPDAYASIVFFRDWIRRFISNHKNCHSAGTYY